VTEFLNSLFSIRSILPLEILLHFSLIQVVSVILKYKFFQSFLKFEILMVTPMKQKSIIRLCLCLLDNHHNFRLRFHLCLELCRPFLQLMKLQPKRLDLLSQYHQESTIFILHQQRISFMPSFPILLPFVFSLTNMMILRKRYFSQIDLLD